MDLTLPGPCLLGADGLHLGTGGGLSRDHRVVQWQGALPLHLSPALTVCGVRPLLEACPALPSYCSAGRVPAAAREPAGQ